MLWVGTGDSAQGPVPQNTSSLGGKVLRISPVDGSPAPGNPFGNAVYTYGHRNVQGLAWRPGTQQMFSIEHGPDVDDEVNLLRAGGNGGWDPNRNGTYDQSVPMTDLVKFPDAMRPVWRSGSPTLATSGGTFVTGSQWRAWDGALVVAALKASRLQVFSLDGPGNVVGTATAVTDQGRLRSAVEGPDGNLYVSTDNGSGRDVILRIAPS
jgi:glucose/arabinose dehydrogenase